MKPGYVDPLLFMGLIGSSIAEGSREIWYSDGSPKTEIDLMRVPWVANHIRREYRERAAWRARQDSNLMASARGIEPR